ncbi:MAG: glycosyltransferase [Candidatus Micrarchaeota archaeon]
MDGEIMTGPKISVIVPVFNEEKRIARCLESIRAQSFKDYELIVVDGHSEDGTVKIAKKYADLICLDQRKCAGNARNIGAKKARGEIVAFIDGDCIAEKNWLARIKENFDSGCVAVGGVVKTHDGRAFDRLIFYLTNNLAFRLAAVFHNYRLIGNNCAYLKSVFEKEKGFDERITNLDDLELGLRVKKRGKMAIDSKMIVSASSRRLRQQGAVKMLMNYYGARKDIKCGRNSQKDYFRNISH